jgi:hypothetical protein
MRHKSNKASDENLAVPNLSISVAEDIGLVPNWNINCRAKRGLTITAT